MSEQNKSNISAGFWYDSPESIENWFYGVFEGGGAKGVAYSGALLAMAKERCWFRAVAGASAGAITAAIVASGLSPDEMKEKTDSALNQVQTGVWAGLYRLQNAEGYFPSEKLRGWLNELFKSQIALKTQVIPVSDVTFLELYTATGIELNVVAADLSSKNQVIFSHNETPNCAVADAVVASSSIPFAFASSILQVAQGEANARIFHHTIVDGGVWSNFPMYIFEDTAFRKRYSRVPQKIDSRYILGFLLNEGEDQAPPRGERIKFVGAIPVSEFYAKEWSRENRLADDKPIALTSRIGAWLLFPFALLGRLLDRNSGVERGRWPTPNSNLAKYLVQSVNGLLSGIYPILFGILVCAIVAIGAWEVTSFIIADQLNTIPDTDWSQPSSYTSRTIGVILASIGLAIGILFLFVAILGVVANRILLRASRRILYGLVTTFVAGSGAPEWLVREKKNIVALPIPPTVSTLSFDMKPEDRDDLIESAKKATLHKLAELLPEINEMRSGKTP